MEQLTMPDAGKKLSEEQSLDIFQPSTHTLIIRAYHCTGTIVPAILCPQGSRGFTLLLPPTPNLSTLGSKAHRRWTTLSPDAHGHRLVVALGALSHFTWHTGGRRPALFAPAAGKTGRPEPAGVPGTLGPVATSAAAVPDRQFPVPAKL